MFPSNFIREIKKTGILWYCDILWYIHLYVKVQVTSKSSDPSSFAIFIITQTT
jgi:hypothetical protein